MANISFTGRIGKEPELRFLPGENSKAVLNFTTAESHRKFDKQSNEWKDTGTTWRNVSLFGAKAERMAETLHKGDLVVIAGREQTRAWQKQDGTEGTSLDVQADEVGFVSRPSNQGGQNASQGQSWGSGQGSAQRPSQGQADPWGQQSGGNYQWGNASQEEAPF